MRAGNPRTLLGVRGIEVGRREAVHLLAYRGVGDRLVDRGIDLVDDGARRLGGAYSLLNQEVAS